MAPKGAISLFVTIFLNVVCWRGAKTRDYEVYVASLSLLIKICPIFGSTSSTCQNPHYIKGPLLPTLSQSFQVDVEANIADKYYTLEATLYYDYPGNQAAMVTFINGSQSKTIYSYKTQELLKIKDYNGYPSCVTETLGSNNSMPFGFAGLQINKPQYVMTYGLNLQSNYVGNTSVRGIHVNHWQACSSYNGGTVQVDYYFSSNWSTATTVPNIPIRVEVTTTGSSPALHHVYDFSFYRPIYDQDATVFQTPVGVICPHRMSMMDLPPIVNSYSLRLEKVYPDLSVIAFEDIWNEFDYKLFRHDYKPLLINYPTYSMNPVTEVHDFTRGLRYVIDKTMGNCTILPINNYSIDAIENMVAYKANGSYILEMKNPLQFFFLNGNFQYIGVQTVRDILCDVFVSNRSDLEIQGFVSNQNVSITVYFNKASWRDISENTGEINDMVRPIKMELNAPVSGLSLIYNIVDFNSQYPPLSIFDVKNCYHEANKLIFKVTLPGIIPQTEIETLLTYSQRYISYTMAVTFLRLTDLHLDYDDGFIYVTATLLDRAPASAQFTPLSGRRNAHADDSVLYNVVDYEQCATYCITNDKQFICNSFDYCGDNSCHLSKEHTDSGKVTNSSSCTHFSRTVDGSPQETSISDAFKKLRNAVYTRKFEIKNTKLTETYIAVDVSILFGWENFAVSLPTVPTHFSYRMESTIPSVKQILASTLWYDGNFKMLRYDLHANRAVGPYYTTDPLTIIEDYNTGIRYAINKMQQNCTVSQISMSDEGASLSDPTKPNATWILGLKNPMNMLNIDNSYKFIGQQTIRGMTCNVFESQRHDFKLPGVDANITSLFRYAFLAGDWSETDAGYLRSTNQPVRLEITVNDFSFYTQYNFFDFNGDTLDLSLFDAHQCFTTNNTQPFQIVFPGSYHPSLDTTSKMFIIETTFKMAGLSKTSALRFQRTRLDYDTNHIYLTSSLVQHTEALTYFTFVANGYIPRGDRVLAFDSPESCASNCLHETGFNCSSFYVCTESNQCLLSKDHVPETQTDGMHVNGCFAYSRTVADQGQQLSNYEAFLNLKNAVYTGKLTVDIPVTGTEHTISFTATSVRNPIRNPYSPPEKENAYRQFTNVSAHAQLESPRVVMEGSSVDDCADACIQEDDFLCNGFGYYPDGYFGYYCSLTIYHPQLLNASAIIHPTVGTVFSRNFLSDYIKTPGVTAVSSHAGTSVSNIQTDEQCAQLCYTNVNFTCRSFQYCMSSKMCLIYASREVGLPQKPDGLNINAPTCNHYSSSYLSDFKAIDAQLYQITSVVGIQKVSVRDCANFCVNQQGIQCQGFYFCTHTSQCYLTSESPGAGSHVNITNNEMDLCRRFSRVFYPPRSSTTPKTMTSSMTRLPSTSKSASTTSQSTNKASATKPPSTSSQSTLTSTRVPKPTPTSTPKPSSTAITKPSSTATSKPIQRSTTMTHLIPTPALQHSDDSSKNNNTGILVGLSVGMFLLGLVIGVVGLHFYRRYKGMDKDDLRTNFAIHEDM